MTIDCNINRLPPHMREPIANYVLFGGPMGHFLQGVLANIFDEAVLRADDVNFAWLIQWARFVHNDMPSLSHGSPAAVRAWQERGGLLRWKPGGPDAGPAA